MKITFLVSCCTLLSLTSFAQQKKYSAEVFSKTLKLKLTKQNQNRINVVLKMSASMQQAHLCHEVYSSGNTQLARAIFVNPTAIKVIGGNCCKKSKPHTDIAKVNLETYKNICKGHGYNTKKSSPFNVMLKRVGGSCMQVLKDGRTWATHISSKKNSIPANYCTWFNSLKIDPKHGQFIRSSHAKCYKSVKAFTKLCKQ